MWARLRSLKPFWQGLCGALAGVVLLVVGYHLWMDHLALHALFARAIAQQQQQPPK